MGETTLPPRQVQKSCLPQRGSALPTSRPLCLRTAARSPARGVRTVAQGDRREPWEGGVPRRRAPSGASLAGGVRARFRGRIAPHGALTGSAPGPQGSRGSPHSASLRAGAGLRSKRPLRGLSPAQTGSSPVMGRDQPNAGRKLDLTLKRLRDGGSSHRNSPTQPGGTGFQPVDHCPTQTGGTGFQPVDHGQDARAPVSDAAGRDGFAGLPRCSPIHGSHTYVSVRIKTASAQSALLAARPEPRPPLTPRPPTRSRARGPRARWPCHGSPCSCTASGRALLLRGSAA